MALKIQALQTDEKGHFIGGFSAAFALAASNPHCAETQYQQVNNCHGGNCPSHCTPHKPTAADSALLYGKNVINNCMKNCSKGCSGGGHRIHFGVYIDTLHH